jgi:hypothetical protein
MFGAIVSRTFIMITLGNSSTFPKPFHVQRREYEFWTGHPPNFSSAPGLWEEEYLDNLAECKGGPIVTPRR